MDLQKQSAIFNVKHFHHTLITYEPFLIDLLTSSVCDIYSYRPIYLCLTKIVNAYFCVLGVIICENALALWSQQANIF